MTMNVIEMKLIDKQLQLPKIMSDLDKIVRFTTGFDPKFPRCPKASILIWTVYPG
jgi:hypothetical protein